MLLPRGQGLADGRPFLQSWVQRHGCSAAGGDADGCCRCTGCLLSVADGAQMSGAPQSGTSTGTQHASSSETSAAELDHLAGTRQQASGHSFRSSTYRGFQHVSPICKPIPVWPASVTNSVLRLFEASLLQQCCADSRIRPTMLTALRVPGQALRAINTDSCTHAHCNGSLHRSRSTKPSGLRVPAVVEVRSASCVIRQPGAQALGGCCRGTSLYVRI